MLKSRQFAVLLVSVSLLASCGKDDKKKSQDDAPPVIGDAAPAPAPEPTPVPEPAPAPGPVAAQPTAEQVCADKGDDFAWQDGACNEVPNAETTGVLSAEPGLIWEASAKTCDTVNPGTDKVYFELCASIDVTIPMPTLPNVRSMNTVALQFTCTNFRQLDADLQVSSAHKGNLAPSKTETRTTVIVEPGTSPVIAIKLVFVDNVVKPGCKIELIENSVAPLD